MDKQRQSYNIMSNTPTAYPEMQLLHQGNSMAGIVLAKVLLMPHHNG